MISLNAMVKQIEGLHDTADLNEWENEFVASVVTRTKHGADTTGLSEKQVDRITALWKKHFA